MQRALAGGLNDRGPERLLCDLVLAATPFAMVCGEQGRHHLLAGCGFKQDLIRTCAARYALDRTASRRCNGMIRDPAFWSDVRQCEDRVPAEPFWLEWWADDVADRPEGQKLGMLVEPRGGRSGAITAYYERTDGRVDLVPMELGFDLDRPYAPRPDGVGRFRIRVGDLPHLDHLLGCVQTQLLTGWDQHVASLDVVQRAKDLRAHVESVWFRLPVLIAFSRLLRERYSGSHALARRLAGDHPMTGNDAIRRAATCISLYLGERAPRGCTTLQRAKAPPRPHRVRGHYVTRGGKTFWRTTHARGGGGGEEASRLVLVHGPAGRRITQVWPT